VLTHRWLACGLALTLAAAAPAAPAPDVPTVKLALKFEKGKTFYQKMTSETNQTMKVMGMDVDQKQVQTFVFSWTPVRQEADKSWVVRQRIEAVQVDMEVAGNKISFDSVKGGGDDNPLRDVFKGMVGCEFTMTISPRLKITKVEGREEFVKRLAETKEELKPLLDQMLSEDALKQMADPAFAAVPDKEVKKGDSWTRASKLSLGALGNYETKSTYTYEGPGKEANIEKISAKIEMTYKPADNDAGGLPFKVTNADLKSSDAVGTIEFRRDKGRIERSEMKTTIKGKITIEVAGTANEVELSQTQTTTVTTSDENPLAAAK
jgi:hypothetical protein